MIYTGGLRDMRQFALAILLLSAGSAKDKPEKIYPEHGTVIAMRTERVTKGGGVYTDSQGKTHGGVVKSHKVSIFKIRTSGMDYELEARHDLSVDQEVNFRIDKRHLWIRQGGKERRYSIVGQEKREIVNPASTSDNRPPRH